MITGFTLLNVVRLSVGVRLSWERTQLSVGCTVIRGSVFRYPWGVRFNVGLYGYPWVRTMLSVGRTDTRGIVLCYPWGERLSVGSYQAVRGRTVTRGAVKCFPWGVRLSVGAYDVVRGVDGLFSTRIMQSIPRTVIGGTV